MRKYIMIVFSLTFIFFIDSTKKNRNPGKYDFVSIVQSWPLTSYWNYQGKWITKASDCVLTDVACLALQRNNWIVHGLWPNKYTGRNPSFCSRNKKSRQYKLGLINEKLKARLNLKWASYCTNLTEERLWKFEWEKHGSCVVDVDGFRTIPKFFSTTLDLQAQYDPGKILAMADIVPGESYEFRSIIQTLRERLKVEPIVKCAIEEDNEELYRQYLSEIHLCLNKSLILQNCNQTHKCDSDKKIFYPIWNAGNSAR